MEPARPRADQNFFGPRAGRLQGVRFHFAIWHMYHRSATIRLSSLRRAHISDAKFLHRRNAARFCTRSGNALLIMTVGGWATTFSCPITYISLRDLKSVRSISRIGWRCGKVSVRGGLRQSSLSSRRSGSRNITIGTCDRAKAIRKNGITSSKTQCEPDSSSPLRRGHITGRSMI